jgi:uncharacterized protein (TIGR00661 family)
MNKKILYGVCGIGSGHTHRQLPLIEHFQVCNTIIIFAYGESLRFYTQYFAQHSNVHVYEVSVPFYVGTKDGIDFEATKLLPINQKDHQAINNIAKQHVYDEFGTPDLVISDYEPTVAEVAYELDVPLVTIDQQSKYLFGTFPTELSGQTYADEIARLLLFFPQAAARIACSFFAVTEKTDAVPVLLFPPILRNPIQELAGVNRDEKTILVYLSAQQACAQSLEEIASIFKEFPDHTFHVFASGVTSAQLPNVHWYEHGNANFLPILARCGGIITTAGHTLLSEAMHLGIPVYALPLPVYEQQMNAYIIATGLFGVSAETVHSTTLQAFLEQLETYAANITTDQSLLLRSDGLTPITDYIESTFLA